MIYKTEIVSELSIQKLLLPKSYKRRTDG